MRFVVVFADNVEHSIIVVNSWTQMKFVYLIPVVRNVGQTANLYYPNKNPWIYMNKVFQKIISYIFKDILKHM